MFTAETRRGEWGGAGGGGCGGLVYVVVALAWQNFCVALRVSAVNRGTVKPEGFRGELLLAWLNAVLWPITATLTMVLTVGRVRRMLRMKELRVDAPLPPELAKQLKKWQSVALPSAGPALRPPAKSAWKFQELCVLGLVALGAVVSIGSWLLIVWLAARK